MRYDKKAKSKGKGKGAKQGRLTDKPDYNGSDDWELQGWLNLSRSGKMVKVSRLVGQDSEFIGLVSIRQLSRLTEGEIQGVPIKTPPEDSEQD